MKSPFTAGCCWNCGYCCFVLSIWGTVQLTVMAGLYYIESAPMIKDVVAKDVTNYELFILKTRHNYRAAAWNCIYASCIYFITLLLSILCMVIGNRRAKREFLEADDEDTFCEPPTLEVQQPKKMDKKKK